MKSIIVSAAVLVLAALATGAAQEPVYKAGDGVTLPTVVREVKPRYSSSALQAKVQGMVLLRVIVKSDGTVGDVEVVKSLEETLDANAIEAARQWIFKPGTREGKPVNVEITLEMTFTLKQ